jgi:hypothetical protein
VSETDLLRSIIKELTSAGYWVFRVNSGTRGSGTVKLAPPGTPDICCVSPPGWIEVKLPGESLSEKQAEWHARAKGRGVRVGSVSGVSEAMVLVGTWVRQDSTREGAALELKRIAEDML